MSSILVVPLLPNRIPIKVLSYFSSRIPWTKLKSLPSSLNQLVSGIPVSSRPHVLANLMAFIPPHYSKLPPAVISSYVRLYYLLLDTIDSRVLEGRTGKPASNDEREKGVVFHDDVDTDDEDVDFSQKSLSGQHLDTSAANSSNLLDSRTLNRLSAMTKPSHLSALLLATSSNVDARADFFRLVLLLILHINVLT